MYGMSNYSLYIYIYIYIYGTYGASILQKYALLQIVESFLGHGWNQIQKCEQTELETSIIENPPRMATTKVEPLVDPPLQ